MVALDGYWGLVGNGINASRTTFISDRVLKMDSAERPLMKNIAMMVILMGFGILLVFGTTGCSNTLTESDSRLRFASYRRVAVLSRLERAEEEYFIPKYMQAFPNQTLVERRDLAEVLTEQDLLVDRIDPEKRVALHRLFGVDGIVYPNFTESNRINQFAVKIVDTLTGEIVAAVLVTPKQAWGRGDATRRDLIKRAIAALESENDNAISSKIRKDSRSAARLGSVAGG